MTTVRKQEDHPPLEIGEAADLVGVSSQAIRDAEKPAGYLTLIWKPVAELNNVRYTIDKSIICGMCFVPDCAC